MPIYLNVCVLWSFCFCGFFFTLDKLTVTAFPCITVYIILPWNHDSFWILYTKALREDEQKTFRDYTHPLRVPLHPSLALKAMTGTFYCLCTSLQGSELSLKCLHGLGKGPLGCSIQKQICLQWAKMVRCYYIQILNLQNLCDQNLSPPPQQKNGQTLLVLNEWVTQGIHLNSLNREIMWKLTCCVKISWSTMINVVSSLRCKLPINQITCIC